MLKSLVEYIKKKRNTPLRRCSKKTVQDIMDADMPESVKVDLLNKLPKENASCVVRKRS
ncbi:MULTISPECIES: hypothetical protein [Cysteiniphilum]|uniref:hypothetical protein n=1 Tax=Cysteiniphilum TaxID=2056696 RepID=UPI0017822D94|nr:MULTISPECIES: hypothetical protein [Cysteiniphilum]